jgi:ribosome biogenesis GTPase
VLEGVVVEYHREHCWVELQPGQAGSAPVEVIAKPRGRLALVAREREHRAREARELERIVARQVAVGDRVHLAEPEPGYYVIEELLERETWLIRRSLGSYRRKPQCVVANADQLAIVIAPSPDVRLNVVDRYMLAAIQGGLEPLIVVNKIDLDQGLPDAVEFRHYRDRGHQVFFTAAKYRLGLEALLPALAGKFTAFCGHSGVGKSTVLSRLAGVDIATAEVKRGTLKGRQMTSTARLYHLPGGGEVVDTPGVREFGLAHLTWLDVHDYFSDIAVLTTQCAYRDCSHAVEPGCKVREAVEQGRLAAGRVASYIKLREECDQQSRPWEAR